MIKFVVVWGYVVEILLSVLIVALAYIIFGFDDVNVFIKKSAIEMATIVGGGIFAASLAFIWALFTKSESKFYLWLASKGAYSVYLNSAAYSALVSLCLVVILIIVKYTDNTKLPIAAFLLLVLALTNVVTLMKNIIELMKLNSVFNKKSVKSSNDDET